MNAVIVGVTAGIAGLLFGAVAAAEGNKNEKQTVQAEEEEPEEECTYEVYYHYTSESAAKRIM